jgi:hypothetical protein
VVDPRSGDKGQTVSVDSTDSGFVMVGYSYGDSDGETTTEKHVYYAW